MYKGSDLDINLSTWLDDVAAETRQSRHRSLAQENLHRWNIQTSVIYTEQAQSVDHVIVFDWVYKYVTLRSEFDSILDAKLTVSPNRQ